MATFAPLSSGSRGNSILVEGPDGAFLVDAGLPGREMIDRLREAGHRPEDLDGIVVTHRHLDHVRGAALLSRRFRIPVFATGPTFAAGRRSTLHDLAVVHPGRPFRLAGYRIHPVHLCHDAPQTLGFLVESRGARIGIATDLGSAGGGLLQLLVNLDLLYLEANHDRAMLADGPYPWPLKHRVAGASGHLSNAQSADILRRLATPRLRCVYLAHLSRTNNRPELATAAARDALFRCGREDVELRVAAQDRVSPTYRL